MCDNSHAALTNTSLLSFSPEQSTPWAINQLASETQGTEKSRSGFIYIVMLDPTAGLVHFFFWEHHLSVWIVLPKLFCVCPHGDKKKDTTRKNVCSLFQWDVCECVLLQGSCSCWLWGGEMTSWRLDPTRWGETSRRRSPL